MSTGTGPTSASASASAEQLLGLRVSELIEAYPGALQVLIDAGFGPLAFPALRASLAHTVTLRQALRIGGLSLEQRMRLLRELEALAPCRS